ncbi:MAG TPA: PadR family transcriptional regulator [Candidatus Anoxymicrobiaceae bacterium]
MANAEPVKQEETHDKPYSRLREAFGQRTPPHFFASPIILMLLAEEPAHGYALFKKMCELGVFAEDMDPSIIYPTLRLMKDDGFIDSELMDEGSGPTRKVFHLTRQGSKELDELAENLGDIFACIEYFQRRYEANVSAKRRTKTKGSSQHGQDRHER